MESPHTPSQSISSFWQHSCPHSSESSLTLPLQTDVCVIGAGIAGLTVAYQLLKANKKVVVVSHTKIGAAQTGLTSAHLSNALDDRYVEIEKMHGLEGARLAAQGHAYAIDEIEKIIKQHNIDCDFRRVEGVLFAKTDLDKMFLEKEFQAAKRAGLEVRLQENPKFEKCLIFSNQAVFHPLKYLVALAKLVKEIGGVILEDTQVEKIDSKSLEVHCAFKGKIQAKDIVCATNSQFFSPMSMHFKLDPQRSYVVGIAVPKGFIPDALYWDNAEPYHYVRIASKNDTQDLLLVGGEDHRVGETADPAAYTKLLAWARQTFTLENPQIDCAWSGQVIEPVNLLGYIGKNPKNAHIYMITGDSGNGLTHGTLAGRVILSLIQGTHHPEHDLYKISGLPLKALPSLLLNMAASMLGYVKFFCLHSRLLPSKGEGKIVQQGLKKVAVYRDANGCVHKKTGICPHMGAVLEWNCVEKTWDCPAHGSRFDVQGNVLNGPTMKKLGDS